MLKKISHLFCVISLLTTSLLFSLETRAQEVPKQKILTNFELSNLQELGPIVNLKTQTITPIKVIFLGPIKSDSLRIKIQPLKALKNIDEVEIKIKSPNNELLFQETVQDKSLWGDTFLKLERDILIPNSGIMKNSKVEVFLLSGGQKIGYTSLLIPEIKVHRDKYSIKNLQFKKLKSRGQSGGQYQKLSFIFENKNISDVKFVTKIIVIDKKNPDTVLFSEILEEDFLEKNKTKNINYILKEIQKRGIYEINVQIFSVINDEPITGILKHNITVEGTVQEKSKLDVNLTEIIFKLDEEKSKLNIMIEGVAENISKDPLTLKIEYKQINKDEEYDYKNLEILEEEILLKDNWFNHNWELNIDNSKFKISGYISVLHKGEEIFKKIINSPLPFKEKKEEIKKEDLETYKSEANNISHLVSQKEVSNTSTLKTVLMIFLVILIIFLTLYFFRKNKSSKNNLLILLLGVSLFSFGGIVDADNNTGTNNSTLQNYWFHPIVKWAYNPSATGEFENFKKVYFSGRATDALTQVGAFQVLPERIIVKFTNKDNAADFIHIESLDFTVEEAKDYHFEISTPPTMNEGSWNIEVFFIMESKIFRSVFTDFEGDLKKIFIDKTPPEFLNIIKYDGGDKGKVWPKVSLKKPLLEAKESERKIAKINKGRNYKFLQDKRRLRLNKVRNLNQKILELREIEEGFVNIQTQINNIPSTSTQLYQNLINEKNNLTVLIQALTSGINILTNEIDNLTNILGEDLGQALVSTTGITNSINLPQLLYTINQPAATLNFLDGVVDGCVNTDNIDSANLSSNITAINCTQKYENNITNIITEVETLQVQLKDIKSQFKKSAININMSCTDNLSGCNPICDSTNGSCAITCSENLSACEYFQIESSTVCPIINGEKVCDIDCEDFPDSCRISDMKIKLRANLCDNPNYCDTTAAKSYEICDNVGNCKNLENSAIETDWYDPIEPNIDNIQFIRNKGNLGGVETIINGDNISETLSTEDKINIRISANDPEDKNYSTHPTKFDVDACGSNTLGSGFYKVNNNDLFCTQVEVPCAESSSLRGVRDRKSGGVCNSQCPSDIPDPNNPGEYLVKYLKENGVCIPQCDHRNLKGCFPFRILPGDNTSCSDEVWLPLVSAVVKNEVFIQTSNCGHTRNATGTSTNFSRFDNALFNIANQN